MELIDDLKVEKWELHLELFKRGNYDNFVGGVIDGKVVRHEKQDYALKILRDEISNYVLYGGCIGGGKSELGSYWLVMMSLLYPGIRSYVARNELNKILDSCYVSIKDICKRIGYSDFTFNANKNFIKFSNGSVIDFVEVKYKPSDPLFEDLGSVPYTIGWVEEGGEIDERGFTKLVERTGRYKNLKYKILDKVLTTCNPKKNWMYLRFYVPYKGGFLPSNMCFIESYMDDNPFLPESYKEKVRSLYSDKEGERKRLLEGDWEYSESNDLLCDYDSIVSIFSNDHVHKGRTYITCDVARLGSDKAILLVWSGFVIVDYYVYDKSKITEIISTIDLLRRKYKVPKNRVIADEDGVGGGVVDVAGILGFVNQKPAIPNKLNQSNYASIQDQCLYLLADKINEGGIWFEANCEKLDRDRIILELDQIRSVEKSNGKLGTKPKSKIRLDIKGSPDYRDAMALRMYFELKPVRRSLISFSSGF